MHRNVAAEEQVCDIFEMYNDRVRFTQGGIHTAVSLALHTSWSAGLLFDELISPLPHLERCF